MAQHKRTLKIRKRQNNKPDNTLSLQAVENLINSKTDHLQNQIKILQSNAITTMVILGDIRNSALLAASSTESTKRRLEELVNNIEVATTNIQEFIGSPQSILNVVEPHVAAEDLRTLAEQINDSSEEDDMVANVSAEYDEEEYMDEDDDYETAVEEAFAAADRYDDAARSSGQRNRRT